jgi:hypothetical protein
MLHRLCAFLVGLALFAAAPAARAGDFDLSGDWGGIIVFDKETQSSVPDVPAEGLSYRIEIHDGAVNAQVRAKDGTWSEYCRDACHLDQKRTNAVIYGIHAADPSPEGIYWVETWVFSVALRDKDHLIVEFARIVRNVGVEKAEGDIRPAFTMQGTGTFERVAPLPTLPPPPPPQIAPPPPHGGDV